MVFGTFDIFHKGHENFLKQARKYGDYLIAVVARDKTVYSVKKQKTIKSEQERLKEIKNSGLANKVALGNLGDKYAIIKKYKPDVICLGYDQKAFVSNLERKLTEFKLRTKITKLNAYHPKKYKSSLLKNKNGN